MKRIVDASPAILLAKIGSIELLRLGASEVLIPVQVFQEIQQSEDIAASIVAQVHKEWLMECVYVPGEMTFPYSLGAGERAVLEQAIALDITQVVTDDLAARLYIEKIGMKPVGTLGILLAAKLAGKIPSVSDKIDALRAAGMYLSEPLIQSILESANEKGNS